VGGRGTATRDIQDFRCTARRTSLLRQASVLTLWLLAALALAVEPWSARGAAKLGSSSLGASRGTAKLGPASPRAGDSAKATPVWLRTVDMVSPTDGWAVGMGAVLHYTAGGQATTTITPEAGETNTPTPTPTAPSPTPSTTPTPSPTIGASASPTASPTPAERPNAVYLPYTRRHDRLVPTLEWRCWDDANPNPCHYELRALAMAAEDDGWAVGEHGTILRWDGTRWRAVDSPTRLALNDVDMAAADEGWAVGDQGTVLHWDGTAWTVIPSPTDQDLHGVAAASPSAVWVIGSWSTVLLWDGVTWTVVESEIWHHWYDIEVLSETGCMGGGPCGDRPPVRRQPLGWQHVGCPSVPQPTTPSTRWTSRRPTAAGR